MTDIGCDGQFQPAGGDSRQASWQSSVEERLRTLETQQRLFSSSIKGGAMVVYDDDQQQVARIGLGSFVGSSGAREVPVFSFSEPTSGRFHLLVDAEEGVLVPIRTIPWVEDTFIPVTSSSFQNTWKTYFSVDALILVVVLLIGADSGTTGEIQINLSGDAGASYTASGTYTIPASTLTTYTYIWDLGELGIDFNTVAYAELEARRTSGAGNINVYNPLQCFLGARSQIPNATATGIPA